MIIKQIVKNIPVALKGELVGKDIFISVIFLGRNFLKIKLQQNSFIWLRNFLESLYQESLDSYKEQGRKQEEWKEFNDNKKIIQGKVDTGFYNKVGLSKISQDRPYVRNGMRQTNG